MSQIDHVTVVVRSLDAAINDYKSLGFIVAPATALPPNSPVAEAFVVFSDYTFIRLIQFKSLPTTASPYTLWRTRVENEGIADVALLVAQPADLERLRAGAPGYTAVDDDANIKCKRITTTAPSPFPSFVADLGQRGSRGVPFGPEFLNHANGAKGIKTVLMSANDTQGSATKLAGMIGSKSESGRVKVGANGDIKMVKAQKGEGPYALDVLAGAANKLDSKLTHWCRMEFVTAAGWVPPPAGSTATPAPAAPNVPGPAPPTGPFFFPSEASFAKVVQFIDHATSKIDIAIYGFSDNDLLAAVDRAKKRNVAIRVISEHETADNQGSDVPTIKNWGVPVKIRNQPPALMHNKFAVIDGKLGLTGSFNWTRGARTQNNENILIFDNPEWVKGYSAEFEKLWGSL